MKRFKILLLFFVLLPLAAYHIPIGAVNLSLDRAYLMVVIVALFTGTFALSKAVGLTTVLLIVSSMISVFFSNDYNFEGFLKLAPSWLQSLLVFYFSYLVARKYGLSFVDKVVKYNYVVVFIATIYGFWFVYILDEVNFTYPFSSWLPDFANDPHKLSMLYNNRLFFPFSSAPRLGFVAGTFALYFYYFTSSKKIKLFYALTSLFIVFVTISRGPLLSIILAVFLGFLVKNLYRGKLNLVISGAVLLLIIGVSISFLNLSQDSQFSRIFMLGTEDDASFQGHLGIRLTVLEMIFSDSLLRLFFGYGLGQIEYILNISSAHSSYFTQLFEQGLIGVFSMAIVFFNLLRRAWIYFRLNGTNQALGLMVLGFYLTILHLTYDALSMVILWAYIGLIWGLIDFNIMKYHENKHDNPML